MPEIFWRVIALPACS